MSMLVVRTTDHRDPLEDAPPRRPGDPCANPRCDGGWVQVLPHYAEKLHPIPDPPALDATDEQLRLYGLQVQSAQRQRVAALDSWYPCKDCRPTAFHRWAMRHWEADHNLGGGCTECATTGGKRRHVA